MKTIIEDTDVKLLDLAREGDHQAFYELVKKYEPLIAATVTGMLGDCPEANDVGQETFIRFYSNMHQYRGEAKIGTYLTRIAINLSLNELKRRKRKFRLFRPLEESAGIFHEDESENNGRIEKKIINKAIQSLHPDFRSVVVLRMIDGYSTKETAALLKIPVGTVLSRLSRAQKKLYQILKPVLGESFE